VNNIFLINDSQSYGMPDNKKEIVHTQDTELVSRCLQNDENAWNELYHTFSEMCRIIAWKYNCSEVFDELYSDFIIKLLGTVNGPQGALSQYKSNVTLKTFLSLVFRHLTIDYLRRRNTENKIRTYEKPIEMYETKYSDQPETSELNFIISDALAQLSELDRKYIDLYYYNSFTLHQIASVMNCNVSSVSRRLKKLQRVLKKNLRKYYKPISRL